jgi:hypothetical protein
MGIYNKVIKQAEVHVLLESKDSEIKRLKSVMFKETLNAESSLDKIIEALSEEFIQEKHLNVDFENLAYAIGRIKANSY